MVNNQIEFNNTYSKKLKRIELRRERKFAGQLVIEDYPELEGLNLRDIRSIDKITLKNLPQLQKCTIWSCGVKELLIDNCPNIETLNVRRNSLTNLEFLLNLRNLTELEIDGNPKLIEILEPYGGDWRKWKVLQIRNPKGSAYLIQKNKEETERETFLKKESELETQQIEQPSY